MFKAGKTYRYIADFFRINVRTAYDIVNDYPRYKKRVGDKRGLTRSFVGNILKVGRRKFNN